jgi:hypothetical protein
MKVDVKELSNNKVAGKLGSPLALASFISATLLAHQICLRPW